MKEPLGGYLAYLAAGFSYLRSWKNFLTISDGILGNSHTAKLTSGNYPFLVLVRLHISLFKLRYDRRTFGSCCLVSMDLLQYIREFGPLMDTQSLTTHRYLL